jgi:hypothetical protein
MTQWEEYYSGSLYLGPINVTEGQVMSMLVHTLAYIYGPDFFLTQFTVFGYTVQYNHVVLGVIVLTGVTTTLNRYVPCSVCDTCQTPLTTGAAYSR